MPPERPSRSLKRRGPLLAPGSGLDVSSAFAAGLTTGDGGAPLWTPPPPSMMPAPPTWTLPQFSPDSPAPSALSGLGAARARGREKQHAKPIQFSQKQPPPPPPAGFSWGPVPVIQPKSQVSILADLSGGRRPKPKEEDAGGSLGDSWVADGFGDTKQG